MSIFWHNEATVMETLFFPSNEKEDLEGAGAPVVWVVATVYVNNQRS